MQTLRAATLLALLAGLALLPFPARAADLVVAVAESLAAALEQIGRDFEAAHPPARVRLEIGARDELVDRIVQGAPIDVFVPADDEVMDRIEPLMLPGTRRDIAQNRLVLIVAPRAVPPASLAELSKVERITLANPLAVPSGRYAKAALERAQLWTALMPKIALAAGERQVRDRVATGEADAGFVYATDAAIVGARVQVAFDVPTVRPIRYAAAIVRASREERAARAFIEYLRSAAARQVLAHYGFTGQ
ncbi:MAG: molybdate ABC transporter substrate-binding protein [Betaproteobacteria bacterium]